ncbi:MAG: hypothetical protein JWM91_4393 [Rhodospirillales bacterium]|nr:hypothetical protein [Rhodospirillales bacterium]
MTSDIGGAVNHPAPHRDRVASSALLFAVVGAPAAWLIQLIVNYGLAAHDCFPHDQPLIGHPEGSDSIQLALVLLNILAIAVAATAGLLARRIWRKTREEHSGSAHHLLDTGEGRTRFLAMWGQLAGIGFLIATIFDTVALYGVPRCFG